MSWLRNTSASLSRLSRALDPRHDYEPHACYSSFCKHWQQAYDIIVKSQPQHLHDDVLAVVNHLEQLSTLLTLEARARDLGSAAPACLEHLLSENLLDKLYEWAVCTGKYENAVRLEQLKLYGSLVSHYSSQVIAAEPFLRPLLKLLSGFRNELPPPNVENQLVVVLNQLCVALMQNMKFIDLFFLTTHASKGSQCEFIIVRLLLASVHREGRTGSMARDALLLCAKMSARSTQLADYMLASNTCPVLATGLSGLYSLLPCTLSEQVSRLSPDHVNSVHKLALFVDSLEFCNAVAQVAHPSIKRHLLDLLYQGFLVPVMGPALLQCGAAEQAAATAYLELVFRCVTAEGALCPVLKFLLRHPYDGQRLVDVVLARLDGEGQLSIVSLSLMETLIDLNCEDVMIELIFKYILNGHHLMAPHRTKTTDPELYRESAVSFLGLQPLCCARPLPKTKEYVDSMAMNGRRVLEFRREDESGRVNGMSDAIAMDNLVQEIKFNYGNPNETLIGNYHAYLCDARFEIVTRNMACTNWSSKYDSVLQPKRETNNNTSKDTREIEIAQCNTKELDSLISVCTSGYETLKTSDTSEKEPHSLTSLVEYENSQLENKTNEAQIDMKEHDSLSSVGESSGYDSFKYRLEESCDTDAFAEDSFWKCVGKMEVPRSYEEVSSVRSWRASAESIIGPFLNSLLKKTASLLELNVTQIVRVTSIISKLVALPTTLLTALLLCPGCVVQPNVPSLYQILTKLREELDELTVDMENSHELIDRARVFLIQREMALVRTRGHTDEGHSHNQDSPSKQEEANFKRGESKRRSLSTSLSSMFGRRLSSSSPSSHGSQNHSPVQNNIAQRRPNFTQESYWNQSITLRSVLNAVILDEWIKELAALAEEHALRLSANVYEDDSYLKFVAL